MALDVPDAFARPATEPEEADVAGVGLRVVGTDERQQRRLAAAVLPREGPPLAVPYLPVEVVEDGAVAVAYAHLVHLDDGLGVVVVAVRGQLAKGLLLVGCKYGVGRLRPYGLERVGRQRHRVVASLFYI